MPRWAGTAACLSALVQSGPAAATAAASGVQPQAAPRPGEAECAERAVAVDLEYTVLESSSSQTISVPRCLASSGVATLGVLWATGTASAADFTAVPSFVVVPAGAPSGPLQLSIAADGVPETSEHFFLWFFEPDPSGPPCELLARVTIAGDLPEGEQGSRTAAQLPQQQAHQPLQAQGPQQAPQEKPPAAVCSGSSSSDQSSAGGPPCPPRAARSYLDVTVAEAEPFYAVDVPRCFPATGLATSTTVDGTARSPADYAGFSFDFVFPAGLPAFPIAGDVVPDPAAEGDETFYIMVAQSPPAGHTSALPCLVRVRVTIADFVEPMTQRQPAKAQRSAAAPQQGSGGAAARRVPTSPRASRRA